MVKPTPVPVLNLLRPVLLLLVLLLSACAAETATGRDDAQIYAAAIRQQYSVDDTFGGTLQPPLVYLVRQTNDAIGDPDIPQSESVLLSAEIQAGISAALADLPAEIIWVDNRADVALDPATGSVAGDGVIIEMGNILTGEGDTLLLSTSIYIANLAAGGQTYILEQVEGTWTVTGDTGVHWIS